MNSIKQEAREARFKKFVKEFVNDHGENWRPLRGLWPEDVAEFWEKYIDRSYSQGVADERKRAAGVARSFNHLMHERQLCQNRNGLEYCGTCEQAYDECSCAARNTGARNAKQAIATEIERGDD